MKFLFSQEDLLEMEKWEGYQEGWNHMYSFLGRLYQELVLAERAKDFWTALSDKQKVFDLAREFGIEV